GISGVRRAILARVLRRCPPAGRGTAWPRSRGPRGRGTPSAAKQKTPAIRDPRRQRYSAPSLRTSADLATHPRQLGTGAPGRARWPASRRPGPVARLIEQLCLCLCSVCGARTGAEIKFPRRDAVGHPSCFRGGPGNRTMRRSQQSQSQLHIEHSDEDCASSPSQILERVQSDRVAVTKPEEDRRRRTIIVEKKNGSFGFTLQSYGIHYKKEKEIEMITYVDYVDYDGPAYRAGMREGDVILSIDGTDMEKADHKTLVNYIKNCDARMRMVVLFEDCVRKVELHMRYIQLQRILQSKMEELERLCVRERQLLEGKWKTHSLPARKKASQANSSGPATPTQTSYSYCRPTVSTEDVAKVALQQQKQPTPPLVFTYQYLDPHYRYMLHPSASSSGEYLLTFEPPRYKDAQQQSTVIVKTPCDQRQSRGNQTNLAAAASSEKASKKAAHGPCHAYAGHLCAPCVGAPPPPAGGNGDNASLDAYDLASPCCDPRCVPSSSSSRQRRSRSQKDHHRKRDSKTEETQTDPQQQQQPAVRSRPHSQASQMTSPAQQSYSIPRRYFHIGAGLVSQCSLHSCTSSEMSTAAAPAGAGESSANSYTTSLSTDTLYWDGTCETASRQVSVKSSKQHNHQQQQQRYAHEPIYVQYGHVKPKSWDNLATKAFGGYGFGYGYLDTSAKCAQKGGSGRSQTKSQGTQYVRADSKQGAGGSNPQPQYTPHTHRRYFQPTKSTESLLSVPKYPNEAMSDSSLSCECLEVSPGPDTAEARFFQSPRQSVASPTDPNFGYYSARRTSRSEYQKNVVSTSSEATRL
ncbi:hypothetical protein NQ318_016762, partial [Aromia moschata]